MNKPIILNIRAIIVTSTTDHIVTIVQVFANQTRYGIKYKTHTLSSKCTNQNEIAFSGIVINLSIYLITSYTNQNTHHNIRNSGRLFIEFSGFKWSGYKSYQGQNVSKQYTKSA